MLESGEIISNNQLKGDYFKIEFLAPEICPGVKAGQFVHMRIAELCDIILRRPFSVCDVNDKGILTLIYKIVGQGTLALSKLKPGICCSLMGPLGTGFSPLNKNEKPVIVAGGYGAAATYLLAKKAKNSGILLIGARTQDNLILVDEFKNTGFKVEISTEDGSAGHKGMVTELLQQLIQNNPDEKFRFYGCGPDPMLMEMGKILLKNSLDGELSLDHVMCCGIGACFACVVKVKDDNPEGWRYARTCKEGPVFKASDIYYENSRKEEIVNH